ncbi:deoxyribodipyrimidine photolyase family protein [Arabidopsis lyrata subsp. lyrata]|uniref:Deoxyribodipyrimidine photolyase family protein n=1 Tax=Arabidopsis lyrata subsp. lyrata TaxID=81972 RepID=D7MG21_ARALL|nr:deoxyribodipyrimidine photolyase family protein [Arabidopsis lyrata subsp. lyrata]
MALLALPHFIPHRLRRNQCRCCLSSATNEGSTAVVWFKHDLRVDDHPGLLASSKHSSVIPLYVLDRRILSRYTTDTLELAIIALEDLRKTLKKQGSNLMLSYGNAENVIADLVKEVRAHSVFVEEEVEYHLCDVLDGVKKKLEGFSLSGEQPRIVFWRTPFYESQNLTDLPQSWEEFKKLKLPISLPVPAARFSSPGSELQWGSVPTLDDLKDYLKESLCEKENSWREMAEASAERVLMERLGNLKESSMEPIVDGSLGKKVDNSAFVTSKRDTVGGGNEAVLNALAGYLRRSVHYEAIEYEKERNAGFISPFGYSAATVSAATDAVRSMEYTVVGNEGPAVLLVHGFGAFLEHYRDNVDNIVNSKNRVWTITVLGFGKSEKPNIIYTELLWAELLRDFMIEVVGEPAHCVGNSIGGYFVALMAFLWPALVKSVVLVNSAGNVVPGYSPLPISRERGVPFGAQLGARLLLFFLQFNVKRLLKDCYPVGMKDPISDPKKKVALLKELCPAMVIKQIVYISFFLTLVSASIGHCPHDEIPEEVNPIICEWIVKATLDSN